ncbi:MAG: methyltransferase [Pseudomonadales bacterium]|nr:methyltransferase [Pseudomonadales bacterium]
MNREKSFFFVLMLTILGALSTQVQAKSIQAIQAGDHRSESNKARDVYRNPRETLEFFGLKPTMTVVEIWPGGGWYTEILGPYLKDQGKLYAAHFSHQQSRAFFKKMRQRFTDRMTNNKETFGDVTIASIYPPGNDVTPAPEASADQVLTFRNVHNWSKGGYDQAMFNAFFKLLKPGGTLGVVEHRAKPNTAFKDMIESGYMTEAYVIQLAEKAGFKLVETSEINANPKDQKNYPNGVWSLPPSLRGKDKRRNEYLAIGESDRMTLKFQKPLEE